MLEEEVRLHEEKLSEIDLIQSQLLSTEFKSSQEYELLKKSLNRSIQEESEKLYEIYSTTLEVISVSSSEENFAESNAQRLHLLKRTQHELDQIYSTTESIMSTPSRYGFTIEKKGLEEAVDSSGFHKNTIVRKGWVNFF